MSCCCDLIAQLRKNKLFSRRIFCHNGNAGPSIKAIPSAKTLVQFDVPMTLSSSCRNDNVTAIKAECPYFLIDQVKSMSVKRRTFQETLDVEFELHKVLTFGIPLRFKFNISLSPSRHLQNSKRRLGNPRQNGCLIHC